MNRADVQILLGRINAQYQYFEYTATNVINEWHRKLKSYDVDDVNRSLDNYLDNNPERPPRTSELTRYLKTIEEKNITTTDYLIDCNLCHKTITLSEYDNHYSKCLKIRSVMTILKRKGQVVEYDELFRYDIETLEKFLNKNKIYEKRNFNGNKNVFRGEEQVN